MRELQPQFFHGKEVEMYQAGLVLEGGGMRGLYTAGVLDFFMEKGIMFSSCYGVSAGACHLCSYLSGQKGRALHISLDYLDDKEYCSPYSLIKTGDLFGVDYCYNRIPNELNLYDYEAFAKYPGKGYAVVTNIETGRPEYMELKDMRRDIEAVRASSSLPLVSRNVQIGDKLYLDGGIADSIPIRRSIKDGNAKNIVVMTKPRGYRRKPSSNMKLIRMKYKNYPKLVEDMERRHIRYNKTMAFIEKEEAEGRAFVFYPETLVKVGRIEKDKKKLKVLYLQGYHDAAINYEAMRRFLERD